MFEKLSKDKQELEVNSNLALLSSKLLVKILAFLDLKSISQLVQTSKPLNQTIHKCLMFQPLVNADEQPLTRHHIPILKPVEIVNKRLPFFTYSLILERKRQLCKQRQQVETIERLKMFCGVSIAALLLIILTFGLTNALGMCYLIFWKCLKYLEFDLPDESNFADAMIVLSGTCLLAACVGAFLGMWDEKITQKKQMLEEHIGITDIYIFTTEDKSKATCNYGQ